MDRPPEPLTPAEHRRLAQIVELEATGLLPLARDAANAAWLADEECEALSRVLRIVLARGRDVSRIGRGLRPMTFSAGLQLQRASYADA